MGWYSLLHATAASPRTRYTALLGTRWAGGRQTATDLVGEYEWGTWDCRGSRRWMGGGRQGPIWSESLHDGGGVGLKGKKVGGGGRPQPSG